MAIDPKKPQKPGDKPAAKPPGGDGAKPNPPAKPAAGAAGAAKPDAKPAPRPDAPQADKGEAAKPAPQSAKVASNKSGSRKFGQVLVDLGFIDDDQLWEILDEAKNANTPVGQAALNRGLITEEQLLQALA